MAVIVIRSFSLVSKSHKIRMTLSPCVNYYSFEMRMRIFLHYCGPTAKATAARSKAKPAYIKITIFTCVKAYSSIHKRNLRNNYSSGSARRLSGRAVQSFSSTRGPEKGTIKARRCAVSLTRWAFCRRIREVQSCGSGNLICNETYQFQPRELFMENTIKVMNNIRDGEFG